MNIARTLSNDTPTEPTIETPQTFAAKLRAIGYHEPVLPPSTPATIPARTCIVRDCGTVIAQGDTSAMCGKCAEETEAMARYVRAHDEYLRARESTPSLRSRIRALLSRFWGPLVLIACVLLTTLGCIAMAQGVEVPDRVIYAIAQVETGTEWRGVGDVRGSWSRGSIGEAGPWQLSPAVLRDLKAYDRRHRVHADPVLAESLTRAWLGRLYRSTGNWPEAIAAYHAGLAGRNRPHGRDYARRVLNLAAF